MGKLIYVADDGRRVSWVDPTGALLSVLVQTLGPATEEPTDGTR